MDYSQYMRRLKSGQSRLIGFQNGQTASMVTLKAQALASSTTKPVSVVTTFSKPGGSVGNVLGGRQMGDTSSASDVFTGVSGVGPTTIARNGSASVIAAAQHCAVFSSAPSSAPYQTTFPCANTTTNVCFIDPPKNAPGQMTCCSKDASQIFRDTSQLVTTQGKQLALRNQYGLPNKLQGLRGAVMNAT